MRPWRRGGTILPGAARCHAALPCLPWRGGGRRTKSCEQAREAVGQLGVGGGGGQVFLPQLDISPGEDREIRWFRHDSPYRWHRPIATFGSTSADAALGRKTAIQHVAAKTAMLMIIFPTDCRESSTR
jgi:hypothetical protein